MKKALAMLLTLAMLFSCLVVGVAEEAKYCPPQSTEDVKEEWIVWEDTWPEGEVIIQTEVDGVYAMYIDGVLDSYYYYVDTETGRMGADFDGDHRMTGMSYRDDETGEWYYSHNGGKKWTTYDYNTGMDVPAELPEGADIKEVPALGEYVYIKPVVADKLTDVDLENGKVNEYDWGTNYENSSVDAWYTEDGLLESYSYWNEDHTIRVQCDWNHKILGYTYVDGYDYYSSSDGENWYVENWDEEKQDWVNVKAELPEYAEFEKLPALGEYVYTVAAPADQLDVEAAAENGRLDTWKDDEGNVTGYYYQQGDVWASYDENGELLYYGYESEDGKQTASYNWNHGLNQIGIELEDGSWMYSEDGETWGYWEWDEEAGESTWVDAELPEGTVIADLPALGTPAEFDRVPVQNIEDLETRLGWVYEEEDEEGNVITVFYSNELAMHMYFDAEGALISYDFWAEDWSEYAEYTADNELLYYETWTEDGKGYIYDAEKDAWYERVFDENGDEQDPVELEKQPEGVEVAPPLTAEPDEVWYPDNTMGVLGLPLRDTVPGLTNKWYHVVPVDLTVDGTTAIPLVASNLYFISNAYVTVAGDSVTVTYDGLPKNGNGWISDECVAWFTSLDQITTEWLNAPESDLAFGQEISRANDLGNAEIALLFVCNRVTYRQPYYDNDTYLPRYWPNLAQWKAYRADLTALLNVQDPNAAEAVVETPVADTVVDSPVADDVVDSPDAGDIVDSPDAGDIVDSPDAGAVAE